MSVRVIARIRPLLKHELDKDAIVTADSAVNDDPKARPTVVRVPNPKNFAESFSFQFSSVFEQDATQQEIFDTESRSCASPIRAVCWLPSTFRRLC
jgi:cephalosporin hydroxylase